MTAPRAEQSPLDRLMDLVMYGTHPKSEAQAAVAAFKRSVCAEDAALSPAREAEIRAENSPAGAAFAIFAESPIPIEGAAMKQLYQIACDLYREAFDAHGAAAFAIQTIAAQEKRIAELEQALEARHGATEGGDPR